MSYQPIENYGVIGDLHTVALVGVDGSIDFMCAPRFLTSRPFGSIVAAPTFGLPEWVGRGPGCSSRGSIPAITAPSVSSSRKRAFSPVLTRSTTPARRPSARDSLTTNVANSLAAVLMDVLSCSCTSYRTGGVTPACPGSVKSGVTGDGGRPSGAVASVC